MLTKTKVLPISRFSSALQSLKLGIKLKVLSCLIVALIVSPVVAKFIENMVIRFTGLDNFAYFALVQTGISLLTTSTIILLLINTLIINPVNQIKSNAQAISEGNLVDYNNIASQDEMGDLSIAVFKMKEELRKIVNDVRNITDQILHGSSQC
jgi:methyl-accepting chemotaxis protein